MDWKIGEYPKALTFECCGRDPDDPEDVDERRRRRSTKFSRRGTPFLSQQSCKNSRATLKRGLLSLEFREQVVLTREAFVAMLGRT